MRLRNLKSILFIFIFQLGVVSLVNAQYYLFIEAEGQQPFYIKRGSETYSSTASGFLILSKLTVKEIDFIIGFPNKLYPEISFKVNGLDRDRGFLLKQVEGKGWMLIDRAGSGMIAGGAVTPQVLSTVAGNSSAGFADLLAEATGDKSLLEKSNYVPAPVIKQTATNTKTNSNSSTAKKIQNQQVSPKPKSWGIIRSIIQSDDSTALRIIYFEKNAKENWDTIFVEIEKPFKSIPPVKTEIIISQSNQKGESPESLPVKSTTVGKNTVENSVSTDCVSPVALPKDVREVQRKMTKSASLDEQIAIAGKAMTERCFTTRQVKELSIVFDEEQHRLLFFAKVRKWVSNPALYGELEQSFLQEGSKKAFREMLKQLPQ
jgi:hypothetical protein